METAENKKEEIASTSKIPSSTINMDDKTRLIKNDVPPNVSTINNSVQNNNMNNIEFNKLQGFDVLEKLPPKSVNDTYNQEFYNTLDNLKFLSLSIPDEDKLFYHFEQNENASISANAGQVLKSFMELFMNKMTIRKILRQCKKEFKAMKIDFDNIEPNITEEIRTEIIKMEKRLQNFLVEQKTETIRLIKEIANLQKEKDKIKDDIEACYERLNKLEKVIGTNKDYNKTVSDVKLANKNGLEVKKIKAVGGPGRAMEGIESNGNAAENNVNTRMTGNTVSAPGEGLSEHFNVNTIESNNIS
jgi:hypothetical protein